MDACEGYDSLDGWAVFSPWVEPQRVNDARRGRAKRPRQEEVKTLIYYTVQLSLQYLCIETENEGDYKF